MLSMISDKLDQIMVMLKRVSGDEIARNYEISTPQAGPLVTHTPAQMNRSPHFAEAVVRCLDQQSKR